MVFVLAIVAVLFVLALNGYFAAVRASAVTAGANMISDALAEARASAVAQNTTVEVRLYDQPTPASPSRAYTTLQLHWIKPDGTTPPVANPSFLPAWVVIDTTVPHSPLIASNTEAATPDASDTRLNSDTRVFHFLPDGSTDLNPATNWFLSVRPASQSDPAHFPVNCACVSVDATTGRVQVYRP